MKLTPINQVKAGDVFRGRDGKIYVAGDETRKCEGCVLYNFACEVQCGGIYGTIITAELPTVRVLEETARYLRERLAQEIVSAEVNGGRAKPEVYDMLHELEGVVGKAEVRL
jgi:hypothetical protein